MMHFFYCKNFYFFAWTFSKTLSCMYISWGKKVHRIKIHG